jgi:hypothetical protein
MVGYGVGSFDTNPSLINDTLVELEQRHSSHRDLNHDGHVDDDDDDNNDGGPMMMNGEENTVDSSPSDQSSVAPSFFIIPPREVTPASVRQRQKQRRLLGGDDNNEENGSRIVSPNTSIESNYTGCRPYRRDKIVNEIDNANARGGEGHADVLKALKNAGILIFIVDSKVSCSISAIMDSVRNVVFHSCQVQKDNSSRTRHELDPSEDEQCCNSLCGGIADPDQPTICDVYSQNQRCLLYRDPDGRLFNLTLASHTTALAARWEGLLQSFSVLQAISLLVILLRSYPCATEGRLNTVFPPFVHQHSHCSSHVHIISVRTYR